jgi:hypothetical protein
MGFKGLFYGIFTILFRKKLERAARFELATLSLGS